MLPYLHHDIMSSWPIMAYQQHVAISCHGLPLKMSSNDISFKASDDHIAGGCWSENGCFTLTQTRNN